MSIFLTIKFYLIVLIISLKPPLYILNIYIKLYIIDSCLMSNAVLLQVYADKYH